MKNKDLMQIVIILLCVIAVAIGLIIWSNKVESDRWNNGYCSCGGHYEYTQAVGHAYTTSYIYTCDKCGNTVELSKHR